MCFGGGSSVSSTPTPSVIPGTTQVDSGESSSATSASRAAYIKSLQKRGFASTIKNQQAQTAGQSETGKTLLGQ